MRTFFSIFFFGITTVMMSQAVTIDNEPAHVEYFRMPSEPLNAAYTTYSADVDVPFSELGKSGFTKSRLIDEYVYLDGYKRINSKGDVEITATLGDFMIWMESHKTNRTKKKDKEGNEQIKVTYAIEIKYSLPISLQVYTRDGDRLLDKYISTNSETKMWTSSYYNSLSELDSYWRIQRTSRLSELHRTMLEEKMKLVAYEINYRYGYSRISDNVKFETIGKKKHPDYEIFQKNVVIIQEAFKLMSADKSLAEIKTRIKPALDFYNAQAAKYKSSAKDDVRLRHICLYNQALAYYWTENFDQAESLTNEIQRKDPKDKDAKRLLEDIEYTRASLIRANKSSRHSVSVGRS